MAVKYAYFSQMLDVYFAKKGAGLSKAFVRQFSKLIRMAGYLADVNSDAHKIIEEYEMLRLSGMVKI